jgi:adenylate kinase family enzyme
LIKCSKNYAAKYLSSVYLFASDEARSSFLVEPFNYVDDIKIPPLRLVFLGPTGSGKTTYIEQFKKFGAIHVNFPQYITQFADEQSTGTNDGMLVTIAALSSLYRKEPYASKGFILEGFPQNRMDVETMIRNQFLVDAFIDLKVTSETCAKRIYSQNDKDKESSAESVVAAISDLSNKYILSH